MPTYYFTYGSNHTDEQGNSLGGCYTPIKADDWGAARAMMFEARGDKFATDYDTPEKAGVKKWELVERSLESVTFNKSRIHKEAVVQALESERQRISTLLSTLDKVEGVLLKLPTEIIEKFSFSCGQIDLDRLSREEVREVLSALSAGKWEKSINGTHGELIDYNGTVDGVPVRLWAASPPDTCRVVEVEETIPEQKIVRRKLICS